VPATGTAGHAPGVETDRAAGTALDILTRLSTVPTTRRAGQASGEQETYGRSRGKVFTDCKSSLITSKHRAPGCTRTRIRYAHTRGAWLVLGQAGHVPRELGICAYRCPGMW